MSKQHVKGAKSSHGGARYAFQLHGKQHQLTFQEAFSYGHTLMAGGHFATAAKIFSRLAKVTGRGPRAKVMLSACAAGLDKYAVCEEILKVAFDGEDRLVIETLQAAFVYHKLGMQADAVREMTKVVEQFENLPTACLLLGDMFAEQGAAHKAAHCWRLAIKRDRPGGAVALSARKQLTSLQPSQRKRQ
ncbi:MAG: tetratricopeptide repeat protein [Pirellulales bacterium]